MARQIVKRTPTRKAKRIANLVKDPYDSAKSQLRTHPTPNGSKPEYSDRPCSEDPLDHEGTLTKGHSDITLQPTPMIAPAIGARRRAGHNEEMTTGKVKPRDSGRKP